MSKGKYNSTVAKIPTVSSLKSQISRLFHELRNLIVGVHPRTRIFHPQYLVNENLRITVEEKFVGGCQITEDKNVLDVGCGLKPYSYTLPKASWFGIDVYSGPKVDLVIDDVSKWEIKDSVFDAVLCTEVLEHATNPEHVLNEIWRVMKPGAVALITTPFIYGIHGQPSDYRRYTPYGLLNASKSFEVIESGLLGGIGSTVVINVNNFLTLVISRSFLLNISLTPFFFVYCAVFNLFGKVFDKIDSTSSFGTNSWVLLRKN
jgi:SAM-dependent methyltransferase